MIEILLKLGLSDKQARVYLATLELGEDTVQNVAEKSGVKRVTVYVILDELMKLGLVSSVERGKKTVFIAENPEELANLLEAQKREIDDKKIYLKDLVPQLKAIYNAQEKKPEVRYFQGADGLETLDRFGIEEFKGKEMLGIIPLDIVEDLFFERRKKAVSVRRDKKIMSRTIYTSKERIPDHINKAEFRDAVYMTKEEFPIDGTIQIFPGWGVKFFNFDRENLFGVLLQSPGVARNMEILYNLAWERAKEKSQD